MDTLMDLVDAIILVTELALVVRFIWCCIQETDQEEQRQAQKKQKRAVIVALITIICVYDIPKLLESYFVKAGSK